MINIKDKQEELLKEHYRNIIDNINEFYEAKKGFIMKDILEEEKYNYYYIHMTKGILHTLIAFEYVEIISCYNGYKNFVYFPKKKIKN